MEKSNDITNLFERYLRNEVTPAEIEQLYACFQEPDNETELTTRILSALERTDEMDPQLLSRLQTMTDRLEERLFTELDDSHAYQDVNSREQKLKVRRIQSWMGYAAGLILLCVTGWGIFQLFESEKSPRTHNRETVPDFSDSAGLYALQPGGNRATLSLSDGRTITLHEAQTGISLQGEGVVYLDAVTPVVGWDTPRTAEIQQLSTPRGGTYRIVLSDGTRVWLNAASSLRFPAHFTGADRMVELDGEAFFEVAERGNGQKFLVKTTSHTIEVTGTQFNVQAYDDGTEDQTTLIEGGVRIHPIGLQANDPHSLTLRPGHMATIHGQHVRVEQVDTAPQVAWRAGRFSFEGKTLEEVGREIERWYDIDIRYEERPPAGMTLFGDAYRDQDITFFIKLLESGGFAHQFDGRTLTVKRKEEPPKQ